MVDQIRVPITAQDDPMIPITSFGPRIVGSPFITLVTPDHGGHCGFISRHRGDARFWAETQVVEFCHKRSCCYLSDRLVEAWDAELYSIQAAAYR